jgi:predicted nucleic acid-binding protein
MTVVVDASIVVPAALTASWVGRLMSQERVAPSLIWSEVASALRQLRYRSELDDRLVDGAINWLETAEIGIHSSRELMSEAVALAS